MLGKCDRPARALGSCAPLHAPAGAAASTPCASGTSCTCTAMCTCPQGQRRWRRVRAAPAGWAERGREPAGRAVARAPVPPALPARPRRPHPVPCCPRRPPAGLCCLQPALQYIAGELSVDAGMVLPVMASHNTVSSCKAGGAGAQSAVAATGGGGTFCPPALQLCIDMPCPALPCTPRPALAALQVRMRFDVESAEFLNLMRPDAAFPQNHFAMLADEARCQVRPVTTEVWRRCPERHLQELLASVHRLPTPAAPCRASPRRRTSAPSRAQ